MKRSGLRGEVGAAGVALAVVIVSLGGVTFFLTKTMSAAARIDEKAEKILSIGRGINSSTDAVIQLNRTNELASSILETAKPLEKKLDRIVGLANRIDRLAGSINNTAGRINATARGINAEAADILDTARSIDQGVAKINANLEVTLEIARAVKKDSGDILRQAKTARRYASEIDGRIPGGTS